MKARPHIFVDADACPHKDVIRDLAEAHDLRVTMVANYAHEIEPGDRVEIVQVDKEPDAVDYAIANRVRRGDIVVTQDYGLAALVLGKGVRALSPRGLVYDSGNIERLLDERYEAQRRRRAGKRTRGPSRLDAHDRENFREALERVIRERLEEGPESTE